MCLTLEAGAVAVGHARSQHAIRIETRLALPWADWLLPKLTLRRGAGDASSCIVLAHERQTDTASLLEADPIRW